MEQQQATPTKSCQSNLAVLLLVGLFACCGLSVLASLGEQSDPIANRSNSGGSSAQQDSEDEQTEVAATSTRAGAVTPMPTQTPVAPPEGRAATVANLRSEPRIAEDTVLGILCPGDQLHYLSMQQIGDAVWYVVKVAAVGESCAARHVTPGTEGWASSTVLAEPSYSVAEYAATTGFRLPTPIPSTAIPAPTAVPAPQPAPARNCHPSYPDVCIPPPPPDLDCGNIPFRWFRVVGNDPHRFDGDNDGIGCER